MRSSVVQLRRCSHERSAISLGALLLLQNCRSRARTSRELIRLNADPLKPPIATSFGCSEENRQFDKKRPNPATIHIKNESALSWQSSSRISITRRRFIATLQPEQVGFCIEPAPETSEFSGVAYNTMARHKNRYGV